MNATTVITRTGEASGYRKSRLLGLGNLLRKDLADWLHGKRPWIVLAATGSVFVLAAANARINEWVIRSFPAEAGDAPAKVISLVPADNLLTALATQFSVLAVIFATMSLLLAERDSGTLAWTISKPVSRTSVLVSKWLSATLVLWLVAVVVPLAITTGMVAVLYGTPDLGTVAVLGLALVTVPAIFVGITLAASTVVSSQAAVGAIALVIFALPAIVGGIVPALTAFFPTSIFGWSIDAATGGSLSIVTPAAWAIAMVGLFLLARNRLFAMDL